MHSITGELDRGRCFRAENAGDVVHEVFEGVEFLFDEFWSAKASMFGGFAKFFQSVFMNSTFLRVVCHAFEIALILYFLYNLVDIAFNIASHTANLL